MLSRLIEWMFGRDKEPRIVDVTSSDDEKLDRQRFRIHHSQMADIDVLRIKLPQWEGRLCLERTVYWTNPKRCDVMLQYEPKEERM